MHDNEVRVWYTLGDPEQLAKHVADKANKAKDKKLQQKLDAIFEGIRTLEQSYYGAPLRITRALS